MNNIKDYNWGKEIIWTSSQEYCGKILVFEKSEMSTPLHFHKQKNKSWFVNAGKFVITWIDTTDGQAYSKELPEGSVFEVPALMPVKLKSLQDNSAIAECSDSNLEDFYQLGQ